MCEKFISNDCIFAFREDQAKKQFSDFKKCKTNRKTNGKTLSKKRKKYHFFKIQNPLKQNFKRAKLFCLVARRGFESRYDFQIVASKV